MKKSDISSVFVRRGVLFLNTIYSMVYLQYWQIIRIMIKILIILDLVLKVLKTDSLDRNSLFLAQ